MEVTEIKTWIIFYLLSFVVLLWALFLTSQGSLLGIGLTLVITVVGLNFALIVSEMRRFARRRAFMERLSTAESPAKSR